MLLLAYDANYKATSVSIMSICWVLRSRASIRRYCPDASLTPR